MKTAIFAIFVVIAGSAGAATIRTSPHQSTAPATTVGTCVSKAGCERACQQAAPNAVQACIMRRCNGCTRP